MQLQKLTTRALCSVTRGPPTKTPAQPQDTRSSLSARGRSGSQQRSISPQQACAVLLLDDDDRLSTGSRAICFAKRTLEIFDRLGCGERMVDKGVTLERRQGLLPATSWSIASTCCPKPATQRPAFINLQQYYVEGYLLERAQQLPNLEMRWKNKVVGVEQHDGSRRTSTVETPDGAYRLRVRLCSSPCDGARSAGARACWAWRARAESSATAS